MPPAAMHIGMIAPQQQMSATAFAPYIRPSLPAFAAHTFPKEAYEILLYIARAYLSSILSLLYPLQSGRLAMRCAGCAVVVHAACCGCAWHAVALCWWGRIGSGLPAAQGLLHAIQRYSASAAAFAALCMKCRLSSSKRRRRCRPAWSRRLVASTAAATMWRRWVRFACSQASSRLEQRCGSRTVSAACTAPTCSLIGRQAVVECFQTAP